MMTNMEYEKKRLLTKTEFDKMKSQLCNITASDSFIQSNYYYDTSNFDYFERNETVRVRLKNGTLNFEYKSQKKVFNNTKASKEVIRSTKFLPKIISIDEKILELIGCMTTLRTNFVLGECLVSLDENHYLGIVDYEIEVELKDINSALHSVLQIFDDIPSTGKYSRFVMELKSIDAYRLAVFNPVDEEFILKELL